MHHHPCDVFENRRISGISFLTIGPAAFLNDQQYWMQKFTMQCLEGLSIICRPDFHLNMYVDQKNLRLWFPSFAHHQWTGPFSWRHLILSLEVHYLIQPLKNGGWKTILSYWGPVTFRGELLNFGGGITPMSQFEGGSSSGRVEFFRQHLLINPCLPFLLNFSKICCKTFAQSGSWFF